MGELAKTNSHDAQIFGVMRPGVVKAAGEVIEGGDPHAPGVTRLLVQGIASRHSGAEDVGATRGCPEPPAADVALRDLVRHPGGKLLRRR